MLAALKLEQLANAGGPVTLRNALPGPRDSEPPVSAGQLR